MVLATAKRRREKCNFAAALSFISAIYLANQWAADLPLFT